MPKAYNPKEVEQRIYQFWMERGYFTPKIDPEKKPFVIIMPPPNVTGELHLGHALTTTLEDIMVRWHRMRGEPTLWLPGIDHAGIAAQVMVEQLIAQEGLTRHELGRDGFLERMWQWMGKYGGAIAEQHKRLGASCDWTRERFTLDEGPSLAVRTTFVNLYEKGLIYRGERIINWCPRCATALSELEVEHEEVPSYLYYVRYPLAEENEKGVITIATTRPETILGDTAVAVNPDDPRFNGLVGRRVVLPELGREIPIIADSAVDPSFGTGALKITPAHDPIDFEVGQRHSLPLVNILNPDGTMNENAGPKYRGLDRFECREKILKDLDEHKFLVKVEPYPHSVGHCCRCGAIIEPIASKQWFVRIAPLAARAIDAVVRGRITIIPERFTRVYLNWLENIRDWCISRQLWWGHRIPVWYCDDCGGVSVSIEEPGFCSHCRSSNIHQDPDVLDTWFSSALWPHSTLGWPEKTDDLKYFYPTTVMETGYDILFFWVARMVMMGLENTGEVPFHTVYLHGLLRDEKGEKMSKVKGNAISPIEAIESYGTDALRFAISTGTAPGNDVKLGAPKLEAGRNFANKLWNAARFVITSIEEGGEPVPAIGEPLPSEDRWILSRLNHLVANVDKLLEDFQFGEAERQIHDFLWGEFCDWYIEIAKIRLRFPPPSPLPILVHVLETSLRLLHPFMPFVTEEIWQNLASHLPDEGRPDSITIAPYPTLDERLFDPQAEEEMESVIEIVRAIRNARAEHRVEPAKWIEAIVSAGEMRPCFELEHQAIETLARVRPLTILDNWEGHEIAAEEVGAFMVYRGVEVILPRGGLFDPGAERKRLEKEMRGGEGEIARLEGKLRDDNFLSRAPANIVEREREKLIARKDKVERLRQRLAELG